jgi:hypothetical protein
MTCRQVKNLNIWYIRRGETGEEGLNEPERARNIKTNARASNVKKEYTKKLIMEGFQ